MLGRQMSLSLHTQNEEGSDLALEGNENRRVELIPVHRIKRMPGAQVGVTRKGVGKVRDFAKKRGHCKPVILSDSDGCMTLLSGAATLEACLEEKEAKVPAVIVRTEGEADDLMFALQSAQLNETLCEIAAGAAIVRLIDSHNFTRKQISQALERSPAWLARMESLCRRLSAPVQGLVAEGKIPPRSAQEIARMPKDTQMRFAISVSDNLLSKENVAYLVNRYLNEDTGAEERDRIVNTPGLALPNDLKHRSKNGGRDNSDSARLSRAIARCLDDSSYLSNLLKNIDVGGTIIRIEDVLALADSLASLIIQLRAAFSPGENQGGDAHD
jgi:ParB-like chromosome segregation protein Spo0J